MFEILELELKSPPFHNLFEISVKSEKRCTSCYKVGRECTEEHLILSITPGFHKSIESSLKGFFAEAVHEYTDCCEKGKSMSEKSSISCLPPLLIINVKRFSFDQATNSSIKNECPIIFDECLHLNSFLSSDATVPIVS